MLQRRCLCSGAVAAAMLLAGLGCGSGAAKLYKVSGKITLDGQPVSAANVQFEPVDPSTGQKSASGRTGSDGTFSLTTNTSGDGAMAGKYKVTVTKAKDDPIQQSGPPPNPADPESMREAMAKFAAQQAKQKQKGTPKAAANELPDEYGSLEKTPLSAEVPSPTYEFALKKGGGT
jgi:hypothetical protein